MKYISAILSTLCFIVCTYNYVQFVKKWGVDRKFCGTIVAKVSRQEGNYKHSYQVDHFLIKFDGVKHNYDLKPTLNDFTFHKVGDQICYDLTPSEVLQDNSITAPSSVLLFGAMGGAISLVLLIVIWVTKIFNW